MWFAGPERFAADELAAMVAASTGGELHVALAPPARWRDVTERAAAGWRATERIARYRDPGDGEPTFAEVAELLSTPPEARYGWVSDLRTGVQLGVLVAANPWFGVLGIRDEGEVFLRSFGPQRLSPLLTDALPDGVGAADEEPVTVRRDELRPGRVAVSDDVLRARRILRLPARVRAEFHVERRDPAGRRSHSVHPVRVSDTAEGRWLLLVGTVYADEHLHLAPAGPDDVADTLDDLRRQLEDS
ncbi:ESX secretion-associated protein EspG [Amycolatopsis suaedae]|uniref:ESX secretion-associated protein EspG n=1 Tax=Amycolatopsis suaedae TaxID=2510978 RepID=A0A4Q7IYY2_9PSEU|nr:ESX secretion-associated protein EspG [Amycolatopsis suaedae]RZQ59263.1 ESX secretion-associated protein EspG [Amycolatopsis suaedae]